MGFDTGNHAFPSLKYDYSPLQNDPKAKCTYRFLGDQQKGTAELLDNRFDNNRFKWSNTSKRVDEFCV